MREIAEQNLDQSKAAMDGFLMIARKALDGVDQQASVICKTSMLFAEQTLSNTFDFAHKLLRMKEPQELVKLQSDFVSRQAQLAGDQTKGRRIERCDKDYFGRSSGTCSTAIRSRVRDAIRRGEWKWRIRTFSISKEAGVTNSHGSALT